MEVCKMIILFNWGVFRFHVKFQGCNPFKKKGTPTKTLQIDFFFNLPLVPRKSQRNSAQHMFRRQGSVASQSRIG